MGEKILKLPSIILKEISWLPYVSTIFLEGLFLQWSKMIGYDPLYDTLEDTVDKAMQEHSVEKVSIAGHSMGGLEAMSYTLNNPDKVDHCITVASPFSGTKAASLGLLQFAFGLYVPSIFQLLPQNTYIKEMKKRIKETMPELEKSNDIMFTNIYSEVDEFISPSNGSLEAILNRKSPIIEENKVKHAHCASFYCNSTMDALESHLDSSPYPLILLHGFTLNKRFFKILKQKFGEKYGERIYAISYDYARKLKV